MNTFRNYYKDHPAISATLTVIIMMGLLRLLRRIPMGYEMSFVVSEIIVGVIMIAIIYILNGEGQLLFSPKGIGYAFKLSWWPLLLMLALSGLTLFGSLMNGTPTSSNPVMVVLGAVVLAFFVGYFEEGLFRGVVLNAFLSRLGGSFKGILMSCVYSSIIFGFIHVYSDFFTFFTNPASFSFLALGQIVGKTISAGFIGFILAVVFIRTHNLTGIAIVHGINDFGPFLYTFLFNTGGLTEYVSGNTAAGQYDVYGYIFQFIFMLPAIFYAYKQLKLVSVPQYGFFEKPWYPMTVKKNK